MRDISHTNKSCGHCNHYQDGDDIIYTLHKDGRTLTMKGSKLYYFLKRIPDPDDYVILSNEGNQLPLYIIEALEIDFYFWNYYSFVLQITVRDLTELLSYLIYRRYCSLYEEQAELGLLNEVLVHETNPGNNGGVFR